MTDLLQIGTEHVIFAQPTNTGVFLIQGPQGARGDVLWIDREDLPAVVAALQGVMAQEPERVEVGG